MKVRLELKIDACPSEGQLAARAWIDLEPATNLWSERELGLRHRARGTWFASFVVDDLLPRLSYRLAIVAPQRTYWALTLRDAQTNALLLSDADTSATTKFQLLGSLPLAKRMQVAAPSNVYYLDALGGRR